MWLRFKKQLRDFRRSPAGQRFKNHYKARQKAAGKPTAFSRVLNLILAAVSFVLGIVFSFIPVVPGFLFFFVTAALLAAESFRVAQVLDAADLKVRSLWRRVTRRRQKLARAMHAPRGRMPRPAK